MCGACGVGTCPTISRFLSCHGNVLPACLGPPPASTARTTAPGGACCRAACALGRCGHILPARHAPACPCACMLVVYCFCVRPQSAPKTRSLNWPTGSTSGADRCGWFFAHPKSTQLCALPRGLTLAVAPACYPHSATHLLSNTRAKQAGVALPGLRACGQAAHAHRPRAPTCGRHLQLGRR